MRVHTSPENLEMLRHAVADYCRDCGIDDEHERDYVADLHAHCLTWAH